MSSLMLLLILQDFGEAAQMSDPVKNNPELARQRIRAALETLLKEGQSRGIVDPSRRAAVGFCFGGNVAYIDGHQSDYAAEGLYHQDTNPTGEVLTSGYLYEVKNIPDFNKTSDTRVELVGVIKI